MNRPDEIAALADRHQRHGNELFETAAALGWKDDGESPLNFIARHERERGRLSATSPGDAVRQSKLLDWNEYEREGVIDEWDAETTFGTFYGVKMNAFCFMPYYDNTDIQNMGCECIEDAKAVCQTDYDRRLNAALAPAERAGDGDEDEDEAYEIGKRDGYADAIQELDLATGGDGEFKGSTLPGGTVDIPAMKQRIISRICDEQSYADLRASGGIFPEAYAATPTPPSADPVPERETYWLVERVGTGLYVKHGTVGGNTSDLTDDAWKAEKFKNERAAFNFVRLCESPWAKELKPTEHMFINKLPMTLRPPSADVARQLCAGGIDPGFDDCPKCGATDDEHCKYEAIQSAAPGGGTDSAK